MCGNEHTHTQENVDNSSSKYSIDVLGKLSDAHCHIQDDRQNIHALVDAWKSATPQDKAVAPLHAGKICLMGVQPSKDLGLEDKESVQQDDIDNSAMASLSLNISSTNLVTVSWNDTDTKGDWDLVSKLAHDHPDRFLPSFGIHPWFTHKYMPLHKQDGNAVEIGGTRRGQGKNGAGGGASGADADGQVALSFSSTALTPVSEAGVDRESFLAMSKQLQEHMAKDGSKEDHTPAQAPSTTQTSDGSPTVGDNTLINIPSRLQHQQPQETSSPISSKLAHYQQVLGLPNSAPASYLADLAARLPEPRALEPAMKELRRKLEEHPNAVLGEIGLDRTARVPEPSYQTTAIPGEQAIDSSASTPTGPKKTSLALTSIQHQLNLVREQLKIAASLNRAVSFHCVQAYGHWHDFLIQEGRRLKQKEADQEYRVQLQHIHANGGTPTISFGSGVFGQDASVRLSKRGAARLRREARDAEWERHVASTVQDSSDEEEDDSDSDQDHNGFGSSSKNEGEKSSSQAETPFVLPPMPNYENVLPPRLCMHSYGGSVDMLRAFVKMDHPPEIFFSFSILINGRLQSNKLKELILAVPGDRLLIESDHHSHTMVDNLLVDMAEKVAEIRGWTVEETIDKTTRNWHRFVYGV
ncbi:hypothetical protein BGZ94_002021 [Podila epigama]|nr:hypothetical protein BGZ94_002021 [Podila epigama]